MEEDGETPPATSHSPDPPSPLRNQTKPEQSGSPPRSPPDATALMPLVQVAAVGGGGSSSNGRGGGGGREDCWSEAETAVLIDAWGERFMELSRGNLKQKHWKEVAEIVSREGRLGKSPKTDLQCKNRIDTVKKKYKQEKARIAAFGGPSKWVFFDKLDRLIGGSSQKVPMGIPMNNRSNLYPRQAKATPQPQQQGVVRRCSESTTWHFRKRSASETESESEHDLSADSGDTPPPPRLLLPPPAKRVKIDMTGGGGGKELGELARAILRFTEVYEKVETSKLKQTAEMEKERMKFSKEIELQRMQFLKTQLEISQLKQDESSRDRERSSRRTGNDISGSKNNGDVSS